jgi:hypothetical protein
MSLSRNSDATRDFNLLSGKRHLILLLALTAAISGVLVGCDYSARWDLYQMEKAMKAAEENHAEQWAETEWKKAQAAFVEAQDLARVRMINEARDKAVEARTWAEEATELSIKRQEEMEKEKDKLGTYRP